MNDNGTSFFLAYKTTFGSVKGVIPEDTQPPFWNTYSGSPYLWLNQIFLKNGVLGIFLE